MAYNKVILMGNLGKDPEVRYMENGGKVATFRLATTERYTDRKGEKKELTEWHNIAVWDKRADFAEKYLRSGMQVLVEGKLRTRTYQDRNNQEQRVTEIVADNLQLCGKRSESEASGAAPAPARAQATQAAPAPAPLTPADDDDLPF